MAVTAQELNIKVSVEFEDGKKVVKEITGQFKDLEKAIKSSDSQLEKSTARQKSQLETVLKANRRLEKQIRLVGKSEIDRIKISSRSAIKEIKLKLRNNKISENVRQGLERQIKLQMKLANTQVAEEVEKNNRALAKQADLLNKNSKASKDAAGGFSKVQTNVITMNQALELARKAFQVLSKAVGFVIQNFRMFEKGLISVAKTANLSASETAKLSKDILKMSLNLPATTTELFEVAKAAGQLGVEKDEITNFTDTLIRLGSAADIAGEQAALSATRILGLTKTPNSEIDEFASALVNLGNNMRANEAEILRTTTVIAQGIGVYNASASAVLALGAASRDLGIRFELAGSALSRTFIQMSKSIQDGGREIEKLSIITGIASKDLEKAFGKDSVGVFRKFLSGLSEFEETKIAAILEQIGLEGVEINRVLPTLVNNLDRVDKAFDLSGMENNLALMKESDRAFAIMDSKIKILGNTFDAIGVKIGQAFGPIMLSVIEATTLVLSNWGKWIEELDKIGGSVEKFADRFLPSMSSVAKSVTEADESISKFIRKILLIPEKRFDEILPSTKTPKEMATFVEKVGKEIKKAGTEAGPLAKHIKEATDKTKAWAKFMEQVKIDALLKKQADALKAIIVENERLGLSIRNVGKSDIQVMNNRIALQIKLVNKRKEEFVGNQKGIDAINEQITLLKKLNKATANDMRLQVVKDIQKENEKLLQQKKLIGKTEFQILGIKLKFEQQLIDKRIKQLSLDELANAKSIQGLNEKKKILAEIAGLQSLEITKNFSDLDKILDRLSIDKAFSSFDGFADAMEQSIEFFNQSTGRVFEATAKVAAGTLALAFEGIVKLAEMVPDSWTNAIVAGFDEGMSLLDDIGLLFENSFSLLPDFITDGFDQGMKLLSDLGDTLFGEDTEVGKDTVGAISAVTPDAVGGAAGGAAGAAIGGLAAADQIADAIQALIDFGPNFLDKIAGIFNSLTDLPGMLTKAFLGVFDAVKNFVANFIPNLLEMIPELLQHFADFLNDLPIVFMDMLNSLPDIIGNILEKLPAIVTDLVSNFISFLPKIAITLIKFLVKDAPKIALSLTKALAIELPIAIIEGVLESAGEIINIIRDLLTGKGLDLGEIRREVSDGAIEDIEKFADTIVGVSSQIFQVANLTADKNAVDRASQIGKEIERGSDKGSKTWIETVNGWFEGIGQFGTDLWNGFANSGVVTWFGDRGSEIWDGFLLPIGQTMGNMGTALWNGVIAPVGNWFGDAGTAIWDAVIEPVGSWFGDQGTQIWKTLSADKNIQKFGDWGTDLWKGIVQGEKTDSGVALSAWGKKIWTGLDEKGLQKAGAWGTKIWKGLEDSEDVKRFGDWGTEIFKGLENSGISKFFGELGTSIFGSMEIAAKKLGGPIAAMFKPITDLFGSDAPSQQDPNNFMEKFAAGGAAGAGSISEGTDGVIYYQGKPIYIPPGVDVKLPSAPTAPTSAPTAPTDVIPFTQDQAAAWIAQFGDGFSDGGLIGGFGSGDTQPIMATPGEFMMNKPTVDSLGAGFFENLNKGGRPGGNSTSNITVNLKIDSQNVDDDFIRTKMVPLLKRELKRASLDGEYLFSQKGIRA